MGIIERRQRQKEEVRALILEAAWKIAREEGWQALSIRRIADAIEYSIPVIYAHFANKEAILSEFTRQGFTMLADRLNETKTTQPEPRQQLEAMSQTYWDFAFEQKEYYQLMFGLGIPACETVRNSPELQQLSAIMIDSIGKAVASGPYPNADAFLKFHTYWSILHGLVSIQMIKRDADPLGQLILKDAVAGFIKSL
ncbi:TetR/AcrR family transcriptional regulator [Fulvivirgaceae bacterium PWU5]|uniref:TetR/AcrR family transcriptional regulator n=1 Tax=Dawidia cretensis TaxID=2782350 RepID=A0AAP2DVS1_9BACT|nr:TetR/AcrR family transcriptional regulator [Dawidia cretensis]MBT1707148.1 TetR/AcrR family transcriptional regulator [Dawidia cretensis]